MNFSTGHKNPTGDGEPILVVDDEPTVLEMLLEVFGSCGFAVSLALNAEDALTLFEKEKGKFDLLFTEICLPGMSGLELAERLVRKKPGIRVLLGSGCLIEESQSRTIRENGYTYFMKPYQFDRLLKAVSPPKNN